MSSDYLIAAIQSVGLCLSSISNRRLDINSGRSIEISSENGYFWLHLDLFQFRSTNRNFRHWHSSTEIEQVLSAWALRRKWHHFIIQIKCDTLFLYVSLSSSRAHSLVSSHSHSTIFFKWIRLVVCWFAFQYYSLQIIINSLKLNGTRSFWNEDIRSLLRSMFIFKRFFSSSSFGSICCCLLLIFFLFVTSFSISFFP